METIKQRLLNAFTLTKELLESIDQKSLQLKIPNVPSNTIGGQYWCIIGARQSYTKAIQHDGEWQGFTCDLTNPGDKKEISNLLDKTADDLKKLKINENKPEAVNKLVELLEHEIQHHGQLIRFMYSNKLKFPRSWNKRYTV